MLANAQIERQITDRWSGYQHQFAGNATRADQAPDDIDFDSPLMRLAAAGRNLTTGAPSSRRRCTATTMSRSSELRNASVEGPSPLRPVARTLGHASPTPSVLLSHSPVANLRGSTGRSAQPMVEPRSPGPGRSTARTAMTELRREIARRDQEAHKAARKKRASAREGASREPAEVESALSLPEP